MYTLSIIVNGIAYSVEMEQNITKEDVEGALRELRTADSGTMETIDGTLVAWNKNSSVHFVARKAQ